MYLEKGILLYFSKGCHSVRACACFWCSTPVHACCFPVPLCTQAISSWLPASVQLKLILHATSDQCLLTWHPAEHTKLRCALAMRSAEQSCRPAVGSRTSVRLSIILTTTKGLTLVPFYPDCRAAADLNLTWQCSGALFTLSASDRGPCSHPHADHVNT